MLRFTTSTTSTNASFFLYFTSPRRQLVAPVAWLVILDDSSYKGLIRHSSRVKHTHTGAIVVDTTLSVVIYVLSVSISLF